MSGDLRFGGATFATFVIRAVTRRHGISKSVEGRSTPTCARDCCNVVADVPKMHAHFAPPDSYRGFVLTLREHVHLVARLSGNDQRARSTTTRAPRPGPARSNRARRACRPRRAPGTSPSRPRLGVRGRYEAAAPSPSQSTSRSPASRSRGHGTPRRPPRRRRRRARTLPSRRATPSGRRRPDRVSSAPFATACTSSLCSPSPSPQVAAARPAASGSRPTTTRTRAPRRPRMTPVSAAGSGNISGASPLPAPSSARRWTTWWLCRYRSRRRPR